MVVTKTDENQIYASVQFLKWFTEDERNIRFLCCFRIYSGDQKSATTLTRYRQCFPAGRTNMLSIISAALKP